MDEDEVPPLEKEGWAIPGAAKKAHYFRDSTSLCGRWFLPLGKVRRCYDTTREMTPDPKQDCAACARKVGK